MWAHLSTGSGYVGGFLGDSVLVMLGFFALGLHEKYNYKFLLKAFKI